MPRSTREWHPVQTGVGGSGIGGIVRGPFLKWVMSLLSSEGLEGLNQRIKSVKNESIPGRKQGM